MVSARVDLKVTWPTVSGPIREPASVNILQTEYRHEMAVLTYYVEPHTKARYKEGSPIRIRWGFVPNATDTFFGTVLYTRPHIENEKHSLRVVCIGTTYPFKDAEPGATNDVSIEQVVREVVLRQRLDVIRERVGVTWPLLVRHTDETGWEYLVRLAQRVGYTLCPNKTSVMCVDPVKMLLANKDSYPVLHYHYGRGNDFRGEIVKFTPELGDQGTTKAKRDWHILAVDPRSAEIIGASTDGTALSTLAPERVPSKFVGFMEQPASSAGEAAARVRGEQLKTRWVHKARMHAWGNARVRPGTGVHIQGVSKESDGLWYVHKVDHDLSAEDKPQKRRYFMEVELLRDSREIAYVAPPAHRPGRSLVAQQGVQSNRKPGTSLFIDGRWVSAVPREVVLS